VRDEANEAVPLDEDTVCRDAGRGIGHRPTLVPRYEPLIIATPIARGPA
jgi:hypothetical protein